MKSTPLNRISVRQIVDLSGVNRQTFYYHFQDIYQLVSYIYETEAVASIAGYKTYSTWADGFYRVFQYIENNREFCLNTLNSLSRFHLDNYLYTVTHDLLMGVIEEISAGMNVKSKYKEFMANFYTLAFIGLVIQWMTSGMKEDPKIIIENLSELIEGNFMKALLRYENKP